MHYSKVIVLGLAAVAAAHPGHEDAEYRHAVEARANTQANKRALEGCAAQLKSRGISDRAAERRREAVNKQREAQGIPVDGEQICMQHDDVSFTSPKVTDSSNI